MSKKEWSNELANPDQVDREMQRPTPREIKVAALAEQNKDVQPEMVDITSTNQKALRVIHDFYGEAVAFEPNETKKGIALHPKAVAYFKGIKNDLQVVPAA